MSCPDESSRLPLHGIRVIEFAGLAPGPFAGMVLADFGAEVIRIDRAGVAVSTDVLSRGKRSIAVKLKSPPGEGTSIIKRLICGPPPPPPSTSSTTKQCSDPKCKCSRSAQSTCPNNKRRKADVVIDPFRPGVLEKLGLGPDVLCGENEGLIFARLSGFRREGKYADMAGHDINYLALSGVLSMLGRKGDKPYAPANIVADFAGGGMMCVLGILMALIERTRSGKGQLVEADMVTGSRYISSFPLMLSRPTSGLPLWNQKRGENILDGGAPWYDVYETADGGWMSVGAIEDHFYKIFLNTLSGALQTPSTHPSTKYLAPFSFPPPSNIRYPHPSQQFDRSTWPELRNFLEMAFRTKTRKEWEDVFVGKDACCVPVLESWEVDGEGKRIEYDERKLKLKSKVDDDGEEVREGGVPEPAPRLGRTPARKVEGFYRDEDGQGEGEGRGMFLTPGSHTKEVLVEIGYSREDVGRLESEGLVDLNDEDGGDVKAKL